MALRWQRDVYEGFTFTLRIYEGGRPLKNQDLYEDIAYGVSKGIWPVTDTTKDSASFAAANSDGLEGERIETLVKKIVNQTKEWLRANEYSPAVLDALKGPEGLTFKIDYRVEGQESYHWPFEP